MLVADARGARDDRNLPSRLFDDDPDHALPLVVGERPELARVDRADDPVRAGLDAEPDLAPQARLVERALVVEGGGRDREDASPLLVRHCRTSLLVVTVARVPDLEQIRAAGPGRLRLGRGSVGDEEVEVAALRRLQDVLYVQPLVAALEHALCGRHSARRRASTSSGTSSVSRRSGTSSTIGSPSRTSPSGPPIAASGATCSTIVPYAVPLIRASEIRTMSRTPCWSSLRGIGRSPTSGHARRADGPGVLEDHHVVGRDVEDGSSARR